MSLGHVCNGQSVHKVLVHLHLITKDVVERNGLVGTTLVTLEVNK